MALVFFAVEPDCAETEFSCGDGECMSNDRLCDGSRDCLDGRDEENCGKYNTCSVITRGSDPGVVIQG